MGFSVWSWLLPSVLCLASHAATDTKTNNSCLYVFWVSTGVEQYAGTDAHVYVSLLGRKGWMDWREIDTASFNDFEAGDLKSYKIWGPPMGEILVLMLRLGYRSSLYGDAWLPHFVEVEDLCEYQKYYFYFKNQWMDAYRTRFEVTPLTKKKILHCLFCNATS